MFERIQNTWAIMGESWRILKRDPRLLIFPLLSGICCLAVLISFAVPIFTSDMLKQTHRDPQMQAIWYVLMFLFYFANYFFITFFNTAIVACAVSRMSGGEPSISGGFNEAFKRIHLILGWALLAATVGLILRVVEERSKLVGRIVAGLLGGVWTMLTYLVVPIIVVEQKGPFAALKESGALFRKTWGERVVGRFSFGLIFLILGVPAWAAGIFGFYLITAMHNTAAGVATITFAVLYLIALSLIQSALQSIFQAAVYMYTQGVSGGQGFPVQLLQKSLVAK